MNKPMEYHVDKAVDTIQKRLADYACDLDYASLSPEAVHATKVRVIDTLGALIGAFFAEPCRITRDLAAQMPGNDGSTVIGTRMKTTPDMAAFANATASRFLDVNDVYHWPGSSLGHPSDVLTPVLAAAECAKADGRGFITGVVLAYEAYLRIADRVFAPEFDPANFCCLGVAMAAGKLLGINREQMSHCISMAVVPNVALNQGRIGHLSMWKAAACGQAGRAGVFAALLARAGMEGPHLPYEGKAGWCDHVVRKRFSLDTMGGNGIRFKIQDTLIKPRPSCATTMSSILAAEKIAPVRSKDVKHVLVEVYRSAKENMATGEHHWNPTSRETADHSIPYVTAATLMDGTITPRSFNEAKIWNPDLRALIHKIEVVANDEFSRAYEQLPVMHKTRVTVVTNSGETLVSESGGDKGDLSQPKTDAQIEDKFRSLAEDVLGARRVNAILDRLWHLEELRDITAIPALFVLD
ncbi:MAG: MmgE/PrpD family protein [Betaproteobacteria bacterium]|nr:MmgE/PrpD family protein [Betaproteobacteria bacterium]